MADTASIATALDDRVRFIYEPVERQLARVVDNLRGLAAGANLAGDAALLEYAVVSGGKKVRPVVTLLAGGSREGHEDELVTMATAVELLHIATLIHDDTVDKAATRRGRATVSSLWGNDVAVLLGDYVFAASATFVCDTRDLRVVRRFSETIMELARGELAERASFHDWSQTVDDYFQRIYNKTASLFCTAAQAGGLLSQAPEEEAAALTRYGYYLGLAFQIMDDVLDFLGTEEELGKPVGADLLQGIITLPVLLYADRHTGEPVVARLRDGGRDAADLARLIELVRESSAIEETLAMMDNCREQAREALALLPASRSRESLEALTDYVVQRRT